MIARLPPVGQRVPLGPCSSPPRIPGMHATWLNSGTAALALALRAALQLRARATRVILPAYGCPDLVAAAVFAGAVPVLVDCAADDPGYDLALLAAACDVQTAAVVAVNFLGIRENLPEIAAVCARSGACLIEDCAQWYPEEPPPVRLDAQIVSFGRGKPVNLLGGGALLVPEGGRLADFVASPQSTLPVLGRAKVHLFNTLLEKHVYGLVSRLPGLHIGETRYHRLAAVSRLDSGRLALLSAAVNAWLSQPRWREAQLREAVGQSSVVMDLPAMHSPRAGRLLRYPVLAREGVDRAALCERLAPWGSSSFYGVALPDIPGVGALVEVPRDCSQARHFAASLITLPVHAGVDARALADLTRELFSAP